MVRINKKAQIGMTLTWFVAFVIIFFIMLVFLALTALLFAEKSILTGDKSKIELQKNTDNSLSQRKLFLLLNLPVEDSIVKEEIIRWKITNNNDIRDNLVKIIQDDLKRDSECTIFIADSGKISINEFSKMDALAINSQRADLEIFYETQKINVASYTGKC
ncbi:MAG: hypothetical protein AABW81_03945 [Nanoarchaeota archaeon]